MRRASTRTSCSASGWKWHSQKPPLSFPRESHDGLPGENLSLELYLPTAVPIFVNSLERIDLPSSDAFLQEDSVHVHAIFSPPFSFSSVHRIRMAHDNQRAGGASITRLWRL